jgi:2-polyprenyl-3-methyl-5-hydroxy-6-metoxy-1,4-benzoquinol methylase
VTGVDTSEFSLRRAKEHTRKAGVRAAFIRGDLVSVLDGRPDRQFDIIICAEVIYLWPQYRDMIKRMADSLKPGGLLCVSHRTKLYYIMEALRARDFDTAATVANSTAGPFRDSKYFNWQTAQELRQLYQSLDLNVLGIHSIDRFAWLAQMPPSGLDEAEQKQLLAIELSEAIGPDLCSRYALVVSRK